MSAWKLLIGTVALLALLFGVGCKTIDWPDLPTVPVLPEWPTQPDEPETVQPWHTVQSDVHDPAAWAETVGIANVSINSKVIRWQVTKGLNRIAAWPRTRKIGNSPNGVLGFIVHRNGVDTLIVGEWLLPSQTSQSGRKPFMATRTHEGKTETFFPPEYEPRPGEDIGIVVMSLNWRGQNQGVRERSNVARVVFQ